MTMHVACAADEAYVGHGATMLHSLLACHANDGVVVHFLHAPAFDHDERARLVGHVERNGGTIELHAIDDARLAGLPAIAGIPPIMWNRVFLTELLPDVDRVLYLDADTLIVDDLGPLWDEPLGDAYAAAVTNVLERAHEHHARELGLPVGQPYFNSGVLLFNLDEMRAGDCTARIVSYARGERLRWPDQDALNAILGRRCRSLHPRWNCMNAVFLLPEATDVFGATAVRDARARPAIVHFEGPGLAKPWHYLSKHPFRRAYLEHRAASPWPDVPMTGRTFGNRLLKPLPTTATLEVLRQLQWVRSRRIARSIAGKRT
jgi:lipopolysaccharide biosynthesis glycosyltransferase